MKITVGNEESRLLAEACRCFSRNPAQVNDLNGVASKQHRNFRPKSCFDILFYFILFYFILFYFILFYLLFAKLVTRLTVRENDHGRYTRYWDDPSLAQLLVGGIGHSKKDRLPEKPVLASIISSKLCQTCPRRGRTPCFRSNWVFREVTSVSHINLKTDWTDYREQCWKTIPRRVDSVECY